MEVKSNYPHSLRQGSSDIFCRGPDIKDVHLAGVLVFSCYPTSYHKLKTTPIYYLLVSASKRYRQGCTLSGPHKAEVKVSGDLLYFLEPGSSFAWCFAEFSSL